MSNPFKVGGFEKRLLVLFLVLSVTPTLLIAFFGAHYFTRSVELVSNPALEESFRNSVEIARELSAKLERDAKAVSMRLAKESHLRKKAGRTLEDFLKRVSEANNTDFTALYRLEEGTTWTLLATYPPDLERIDTHATFDIIPGRAGPQSLTFSDHDVIASGVLKGRDSLFVAGFTLEGGMMEMMRKTGDDLSRYRSVGMYVSILRRYMIIMISALVAIMAISSTVVSRLIARRISHPITELARATERIAKGDLTHRVSVNAKDEIRSLISSFNNMTQELLENKRDLIRTQRIAAWREVARRIAHEIKNPLTPIEIAIYRLKKRLGIDTREHEVIEECLDSILKEVSTLKNIAQEFSSFAKLPEPKFQDLDPNEAIRSVLGLYASSFENIEITTEYAANLPSVMADDDQIRRVLENLVKNALEAMPRGGRLTVTTSLVELDTTDRGKYVRIEISDTGSGIPEDLKDKIFDPYFTTKQTGTGLGLAMAYRIVEDHAGKIAFTTGSAGTTFIVELPIDRKGKGAQLEESNGADHRR
jgi:nitrogen fixation/metabolism regulation signal transduction histidine kinase